MSLIFFYFKMNETVESTCGVCYLTIKNKIIFECSHEICLKCLYQILKTKDDLLCPFCRKQIIYENESNESIPGMSEITISQEENIFKDIIRKDFNEESTFYKVTFTLGNDILQFDFLILSGFDSVSVLDLITTLLVTTELRIQALRRGVVNQGRCEIIPVEHYLQEFYDIIIKRFIRE